MLVGYWSIVFFLYVCYEKESELFIYKGNKPDNLYRYHY